MSTQQSISLADVLPNPQDRESDKANQVQSMFDRLAPRYDLLNDWISLGMHRPWKKYACRRLELNTGEHVLDVCTGTGDLTGYLSDLVGVHGHVEGLDFSADMLMEARKRFQDKPNVRFTRGDAQALPFEDESFDGVIISFGLRNITNIHLALSEMYRILKPGGRMINLDTCPKPQIPFANLYFSYVMPKIGAVLAKDEAAYRYLSESTRHFLTPAQLEQAFKAVGCEPVESSMLMLGLASMQVGVKPY